MAFWILFFLSGLAGLVYEIVWVRELILVFGASTFAVATVLTAFMGGLALGSKLFGNRADRIDSPLRVYGFLEIGIGLYALVIHPLFGTLIPLYRVIWNGLHLSFYPFSLIRFALVSIVLLFPTTCMGGTLPLLSSHAARRGGRSAVTKIGWLYAINTAGAVIGVLFCAFLILPAFGTFRTTLLVATLNLLIGGTALVLSRRQKAAPEEAGNRRLEAKASGPTPQTSNFAFPVLIAFALSGAAAMVYEVAWTRLLTQILGSTIYSFATLLATFLLGLTIGSALFAVIAPRLKHPFVVLGIVQCGAGLLAFGGEYLFGTLPSIFLGLLSILHSAQRYLPAAKFLIAGLVMLPATLLIGGVFPLTLRILLPEGSEKREAGEEVGRAYAFNTVGTIFGSFGAGFLLLPVLGMQKAIFLAVALNLGVGLLLIHLSPEPSRIRGWVTGGSLALITIGFLSGPTWDPLSLSSEIFGKSKSMELLFYKEGLNAAVTVAENPTLDPVPHLTMAIDGKANASTAGDMPTQVLVAQIPLLLAPNPERAFVVGLGSGITVGSAAQHPLREITVAELEPAVVEGSHYFDDFNHRPLADPRIRLLVDDARNYLLVTPETFDVIISEPSHPWRSGSAKLFTKEFFELGRRRLAPNGLFAQWIHFYGIKPRELKGIIRTFHVVFPEVLVFYTPAGDLILLGSVEPIRIDPERIGKRMGNAKVSFELGRIKVDSIYDLFAYFILGTKEVEAYLGPSGPLNTDDDTFVEFQTPKSLFEDTLAIHLAEMNRYSTGAAPYLIGPEGDGEQRAEIEADMAEAYQKKDRLEDAERAIRRALTLHPSADGFRRLALILEARGREDDAMGAWTSALGLDPNHRESLMDLTRFEQERGDLKEMARYLDRWRRAHPQDPLVSYYQGIRLYYDGHAADALRELDRIGPIGGPLADYYRSLALVKLSRKGDAEAALNHFFEGLNLQRKLLEENPKNFNKLPIIKAEKMRAARGVRIPEEERLYQLFNRIVGDPLNHFYSGMGLYMLGYFKESADELSQGLKLLGERRHGSLGEFYLALAYKKMGRYKEAIEQLQSFLDAGGDGGFRLAEAKRDIEEILKRQGRTGKA